ncbi:MAG: response regulator [Acaryochloridaceae cyanobacterium RU_4_10]|nr:response regulator [Acaryochloridaceae cyanobacterium RU_4_10]
MQTESKVNVLLVDDRPENLIALEAVLSPLEQNLVSVRSGAQALKCLLDRDFAVILLDVQMSEMNGFETATLIRERLRSRDIPIIFLTAFNENKKQIFKGYSLGAVDYLVKPVEPEVLLSKVTVFVELFKKTAQIKQQAAEITQLNADLEKRVVERTAQLLAANRQKDDLIRSEQKAKITAQQAEQRFRDLINGLGHAIFWEADAKTFQFTFVSQSAEVLLGYPFERWTSEPDFWVKLLHSEDREGVLAYCHQEMSQGRDFEVEYRTIAANDRIVWLRNKIYLVPDAREKVQKLRGLIIDITESKKAEASLRSYADRLTHLTTVLTQTNLTLEKRNQELDQFAYVTSHDLKAPLRAINNLSHWLEEDLQDKLTDEARHHIDLLQGRIYRMENMIDGLLQYARVGRLKMESETVDVEELLKEAIASLAPPPEFAIEIGLGMPTLFTVRILLEQVFTNLIGNAIKHHHAQGTVRITAQNKGDFHEFAVSDDGPGIAPQYHEKVFALFQTLLPRDTHESTGIGLSLVKKIVENEKGTITLESQEEKGTTIRFTWPSGIVSQPDTAKDVMMST